MSETADEDLWTPEELPPPGGEDSIVEIDPYTVTLLEQDFQRRQEMEAAEALAVAQEPRAEAFTVTSFEEEGQDPVLLIGPESMRQVHVAARAIPGCGVCVWATPNLCSRCALEGYARGAGGG